MNKRPATLILAVVLAAQVQAPAPAFTCKIMRFGNAKPTCMCRGEKRSLASLADGGLSGEEVIMTQQMTIMAALNAVADEIAMVDPRARAGWIVYLLQLIEVDNTDAAEAMVADLTKILIYRIARGRW
jgi:hypothetical protein